jgi:hypothetical protein
MAITRRTFIQKLSLGVGAAMLSPIAQTLFNEAQGETVGRKRAVFFLHGNGMNPDFGFTPTEIRARDPKLESPIMDGPKNYAWPKMLGALQPYRDRMLLVDGLSNEVGKSQHSAGYAALSCFTAANNAPNEYGGPPGNITIDQFLADKLSVNQPVKSALYGVNSQGTKTHSVISAAGPSRPEAHIMSPNMFFDSLFGPLAANDKGVRTNVVRDKFVLDALRGDIKKLQNSFAPTERRKLDHYLGAIDEFDKRQKAIGMLSCKAPANPGDAAKFTVEDRLEAMTDMAMLAVTCGMTSVVGVSAGCGMSHQWFPGYQRIAKGTQFESEGFVNSHGHDPKEIQGPAMELIHNFHSSLMMRMISTLSAIKEGDKTIFDNTVMLYTSDNAEAHHSSKRRWPLVILGNAGGKLKADGRFIRYPQKGTAGARSMADLFCSLSTACGVPNDSFGKGGVEVVKGPLPELMA